MASIQGNYYRLTNDEASLIRQDDTRQPLNPDQLGNLRQNVAKTEFVINTVQELSVGMYTEKFESVNAMNAYINTTEGWRTVDMTTTDEENEEAIIEPPYSIQAGNLKYNWAPQIIMNVTTGEDEIVATSVGINAENTDNIAGNYITKWTDIQTKTKLLPLALAGGSEATPDKYYGDHKMILQGPAGSYGEGSSGLILGFPSDAISEESNWTIVFGFQGNNDGSISALILGSVIEEEWSTWALQMTSDSTYKLFFNGEAVHVFEIQGITSVRALRSIQMQCLVLQYDYEARKLYLLDWTGEEGEESYNLGDPYTVSEEVPHPALFARWGNRGMGEIDPERAPFAVGTIVVWDSMLSLGNAKLMKLHIASL